MAENLDALAKVMYEAVSAEVLTGGGPWAESQHWQIWFHASARAALKYLGLDPENPPEEGAVGKARQAINRYCSEVCDAPSGDERRECYPNCPLLDADRALGGE